jgi:hypothetical protein
MNKYQKALNTIADTLTYYTVRKDLALLPSDNEIFDSMATLRELIKKAESFEWIPVSERLPEPPKGRDPKLDYKMLDIYLVSVSDEGYPIRSFWDGKDFGDGMFKLDVKAWMPLPNPYKENQNDC